MEELKRLLQMARTVMEHQGCHLPQLIRMRNGKAELYTISEMDSEDHKNKLEQMIVKFVDEGSDSICFISEAWSLPTEYFETWKQYPSVHDNPHKVEILSAIYSTKSTEIHASATINRNNDEVLLSEWQITDLTGHQTTGRFTQFWEKARRKHYKDN